MKQAFALQLRREREWRGWSRTYIAEQLNVDVMTVGRWERGEHVPHPYHRQKLCALFEKNAQDLGLFSEASEEHSQQNHIVSLNISYRVPSESDPNASIKIAAYESLVKLLALKDVNWEPDKTEDHILTT